MKNKLNKIVLIISLIIMILIGSKYITNYKVVGIGGVIYLSITIALIVIYQKYLKYDTTFKLRTNYYIIGAAMLVCVLINTVLKTDLKFLIIELISIPVFYLMFLRNVEKERYLATFFFALIIPFIIKDNMSLLFLGTFMIGILMINKIDITTYERKMNYLLINISELLMVYICIKCYQFIPYSLLYILYLFKTIGMKRAIKTSIPGIVLGIVIFILNLTIPLPFFEISDKITSIDLINQMLGFHIFGLLFIIISELISKNRELDIKETTLYMVTLIIVAFNNDFTNCVLITLLLTIIMTCKELKNWSFYKKTIKTYKVKSKKSFTNIEKISAVIPNYNYEKYIEERIDSILFQTYPIYELIILDDCSKDNSIEVIKKKLKEVNEEYPGLKTKFIPNKVNSGNVFKQWKKCFEESSGDYLWICEADDSASPYFLENVMKAFEKDKNVILSQTESLTMDENNKLLMGNLREWVDIFETDKWHDNFIDDGKYFNSNYLIVNNKIANASGVVFKKVKDVPFKKYLTEAEKYHLAGDWYFYEKVLDHGKIAYNRKSLNYHRMHSSSVTLTTTREKEYEEICRIQDDIFSRYKTSEEANNKVEYRRYKIRTTYGFSEEELALEKINLKELIKKKKLEKEILLSIIVPVYNTEPYLEKCLNSIVEDVPENTEIIIINDGSPDNSEKIIKKFEKEYKDIIKYYKKENGGLSHTKNYGLSKARGKYIGFVDSDDYIKPNMFKTMIKGALVENADVVYCDVELVYEDGSNRINLTTNPNRDDELMSHLDTSLMPASWSKIVKKELFEGLDYPVKMNNEDIAVSPILFARSKKTYKIPTPFYKYFQRTGSIQNSGFSEKRFVAFKTAKICFDRAKEFDENTQEKIKGTIYTHQLLALLLCLIIAEKGRKKRLGFIETFVDEMNKFSDFATNKYVIEYLESYNKLKLLKLIKNREIKKIDLFLQLSSKV